MPALETYLRELRDHRGTTTPETSLYPALKALLDEAGARLKPAVIARVHPANQGAGIPDLGLYDAHQPEGQLPAHGVIEVKPVEHDLLAVAQSPQVAKYLELYGQVLVTNYAQFVLVTQGGIEERYDLAPNAVAFWQAAAHPRALAAQHETALLEYLMRVMRRNAPLADPKEVAWLLASYAREALARVETAGELPALNQIKQALQAALAMTFDEDKGDHFFRSTLVQTLFYGVFSAWVLWAERFPPQPSDAKFDLWRDTRTSTIPVIRELFHQLTEPGSLKALGLEDLLNWTVAALNRVDRPVFFAKFDKGDAVQYFYEPFLKEFDPELRKDLGVWYTPKEIVQYMVNRVDSVLKTELGIAAGLADENVIVLDPACGTGAFLVEVIRFIRERVAANEGKVAGGNAARNAILNRIYGFEILSAPFVVSHLQIGLLLSRWQASLNSDQRAQVYLTNALTDWVPGNVRSKQSALQFLQQERDAAELVKQGKKILVVIGNPPYNAFAGTSTEEEDGLIDTYKKGLREEWGLKKYNLDDLYVRFFRIAEHCIAELNEDGRGVLCYISNYSYLSEPSYVVMRQRLLGAFDQLWFDNLNGDSRDTGKRIPAGLPNAGTPDPSIFSTPANREGIRKGTAIGLMVRKAEREAVPTIRYRDFWGTQKREELLASLDSEDFDGQYRVSGPVKDTRFAFQPQAINADYIAWPKLTDLCALPPQNGLMEKRKGALIDIDRDRLSSRMERYFDKGISWEYIVGSGHGLAENAAGFEAQYARRLALENVFQDELIVRYAFHPFDTRWCYYTSVGSIWNRPRPDLWRQVRDNNEFFIARPMAVQANEGVPVSYTRVLGDNDYQRGHSYFFPFTLHLTGTGLEREQAGLRTERFDAVSANLSKLARRYLASLSLVDPDTDPQQAALIWLHALAIGFSPAYLRENADGVRGDFPRIPLPAQKDTLLDSAGLGRLIANLLDTEKPVEGVTLNSIQPELRGVAVITVADGHQPDYALKAGWGNPTEAGVMPGRGKFAERDDGALDIYLNDTTCWANVPLAVWEYTLGGYQVLKKWLSYREERVLGRPLRPDEAREFMHNARRIAALLALNDALDASYRACAADTAG